MDIRKNDTERAINLLKLYKARLNKPDEKSLRKAMEKLIETLESQLYNALLDIQEFYEVTLSNSIPSGQPPIEKVQEVTLVEKPATSDKPKREKSKKSKRHQKSLDEDDGPVEMSKVMSPQELPREEEYEYEEPQHQLPQDIPQESADLDDDQNPWLFFEILLNKGKKGYGFAVAGGLDKNHYEGDSGIFVTKIIPGGAAEVDGQLRIDDVIVSVNETNLESVIHDVAVETLKNAGKNMTLIIRRLKDEFYSNDQVEEYQEEHQEASNAGLYSPPVEQASEQEPSDDGGFEQFEVILTKKQGMGLGFSILGGYDIDNPSESSYVSVSKLTPGGIAEVDGRLGVNDILIMVDDQALNGLTHDECVSILKNTGKVVKLLFGRFMEAPPEEEPVVEKIEKKKKKKHKRDRNED